MGNIMTHPKSVADQADSQVTLNATITKENSVISNIQFEHYDGEIEEGNEEEWGDINEFSSSKSLLNEHCSFLWVVFLFCQTIARRMNFATC